MLFVNGRYLGHVISITSGELGDVVHWRRRNPWGFGQHGATDWPVSYAGPADLVCPD